MGGGIVGDIFSLDGMHYEVINEGVQLKLEGDDWCRGILYKKEGATDEEVLCMKAIDFFETARKVYAREQATTLEFNIETYV